MSRVRKLVNPFGAGVADGIGGQLSPEETLWFSFPPRDMGHRFSHGHPLYGRVFPSFWLRSPLHVLLRGCWSQAHSRLWGWTPIACLQLPAGPALTHRPRALASWAPERGSSLLYLIVAKSIPWRLKTTWG